VLEKMVARDGIEPPTPAFSGCGSAVVSQMKTFLTALMKAIPYVSKPP